MPLWKTWRQVLSGLLFQILSMILICKSLWNHNNWWVFFVEGSVYNSAKVIICATLIMVFVVESFVTLIQPTVTWEESLHERSLTWSWPVGVSIGGIALLQLTDVGRPIPLWTVPFPSQGTIYGGTSLHFSTILWSNVKGIFNFLMMKLIYPEDQGLVLKSRECQMQLVWLTLSNKMAVISPAISRRVILK